MARNDSSYGYYNFPQTIAVTTETPLLAPNASGVYAGLPSPTIPLSTTTFPSGVFTGVPNDIAGGEFDGHGFEVKVCAKVTTSATANLTVNLYNVKATGITGGPAASTYALAAPQNFTASSTTKVAAGTATAVGTGGASINLVLSVQFLWDSTSGKLNPTVATMYQNGASVTVTPAVASAVGLSDLNFIPTFTVSAGTATFNVTEIVINKI